jgi:EmrB/QacA subfamily drug resistance transporter
MKKTSHKGVALLVTTLAALLTPFMGSSVNVALPTIGKEFSMDAVLLSWVAMSYLLAAAIFLVPFGKIADIYGRKKIFLAGIIIYTSSSLFSGLSRSGAFLIFFRVAQGIGASMIFGTSGAILTSVFPAGERGKIFGINAMAVYMGLCIGPFIGGLLTERFGWRSIFFVNVPVGLMIILAVLWKLKGEWAEAKEEKFDTAGAVIYSFALTFLMYGFSSLADPSGKWFTLMGLAGIAFFIRWELKAKHPVLEIRLFRHNAVFAFSNAAALINYSATFAVGFLLSLYFQYIKGFSPGKAGLILVSQPVVMAILSPFAGSISDRVESRIVSSIGMALTFAGLLPFIFLKADTSLDLIVVSLIVQGVGFAFFSSPNTNAVMGSVEKKYYGVTVATLGTMRLTGQMLSMGITMLVLVLHVGKVQITPLYYRSFLSGNRTAFIIFSVLCFAGIFASLARGNSRVQRE